MAEHSFGGPWTAQKLGCVEEYANAWMSIMALEAQKWDWRTRYIDAFSGTGSYKPRKPKSHVADDTDDLFKSNDTEEEKGQIKRGSARIALEMEPAFDRIDLIESNPEYVRILEDLAGDRLNESVFVHCEDANQALSRIARTFLPKDRGLAFIDPYDCQVHWNTLKELAKTEVIDVWYLFPLMGVNRRLKSDKVEIGEQTEEVLTLVLGTTDWEKEFYNVHIETNLFGDVPRTTRDAGPNKVEAFFLKRLAEVFAYAHRDCLRLKNSKNGEMFSLSFAMGNRSDAAIRAAKRLASAAIKKWEERI